MGALTRSSLAIALAALLVTGPSWALSVFQKNHPLVEKGRKAYEDGRYEDALRAFEEAKKELLRSSAVDFNRGNVLYKMGRLDDARDAFQGVLESAPGELKQKDYYNLGNTWAALGKRDEAIAAYRRALRLDPNDVQARHNLELMLRRLPPPPPPDAGTPPDAGASPDAGQPDGGSQPSKGGGDGGTDAGEGQSNPNPEEQGPRDGGSSQEPEPQWADGGIVPLPKLTPEEAKKLLDSMKRNEKSLQLWKFQQKKQRKSDDKDW